MARKTSPGDDLPRPLFILYSVDAVVNDYDIDYVRSHFWESFCKRDKDIWKSQIKNSMTLTALQNALIYATIFGGWPRNMRFSINDFDVAQTIDNALQDSNQNESVLQWINYYSHFGNFSNVLSPLEPDIYGEYFVLDVLRSSDLSQDEWAKRVGEKIIDSKRFLIRTCQDYATTNLYKPLVDFLSKINCPNVEHAEVIVECYRSILDELRRDAKRTKTKQESVQTMIKRLSNPCNFNSQYLRESYISVLCGEIYETTQKWRSKHYPEYMDAHREWPDNPIIAEPLIQILGLKIYSEYRSGNVQEGNNLTIALNDVVNNVGLGHDCILESYPVALGNVISGKIYINNTAKLSELQDGIDKQNQLEAMVSELRNERQYIAFLDLFNNVMTYQAMYADAGEYEELVDLFCDFVKKHIQENDLQRYYWMLAYSISFNCKSLFLHNRISAAEKLLEVFILVSNKCILHYKRGLIHSRYLHAKQQLIDATKMSIFPNEIAEKVRERLDEISIYPFF